MNESEKGHFAGHQAFAAVALLVGLLNKALNNGHGFSHTISETEFRLTVEPLSPDEGPRHKPAGVF
jgi:hypothetical protein